MPEKSVIVVMGEGQGMAAFRTFFDRDKHDVRFPDDDNDSLTEVLKEVRFCGSYGLILVFDLDEKDCEKGVDEYFKCIDEEINKPSVIIVGNKIGKSEKLATKLSRSLEICAEKKNVLYSEITSDGLYWGVSSSDNLSGISSHGSLPKVSSSEISPYNDLPETSLHKKLLENIEGVLGGLEGILSSRSKSTSPGSRDPSVTYVVKDRTSSSDNSFLTFLRPCMPIGVCTCVLDIFRDRPRYSDYYPKEVLPGTHQRNLRQEALADLDDSSTTRGI